LRSVVTVLPTFNEGERLAAFLEDWAGVGLANTAVQATAFVVDDGSGTREAQEHKAAVERTERMLRERESPHQVRYIRADRNGGKGAAIRLGWSQAPGNADWLTFIDADGAIPAREYWRVAGMLPATDADVVCGCRIKMAGRTIDRTLFRHLQGRIFATFAEELFHLGFYDTQTGMKAFRASMVRPLLPALKEDRWLLDVELLVLMSRAGARAIEVPVDCFMRRGSSLVFALDPIRMGIQLVRLKSRLRREERVRS
jgi:dolichyl-phosphate beta-glucosyltransferase